MRPPNIPGSQRCLSLGPSPLSSSLRLVLSFYRHTSPSPFLSSQLLRRSERSVVAVTVQLKPPASPFLFSLSHCSTAVSCGCFCRQSVATAGVAAAALSEFHQPAAAVRHEQPRLLLLRTADAAIRHYRSLVARLASPSNPVLLFTVLRRPSVASRPDRRRHWNNTGTAALRCSHRCYATSRCISAWSSPPIPPLLFLFLFRRSECSAAVVTAQSATAAARFAKLCSATLVSL